MYGRPAKIRLQNMTRRKKIRNEEVADPKGNASPIVSNASSTNPTAQVNQTPSFLTNKPKVSEPSTSALIICRNKYAAANEVGGLYMR